MQRLFLLVAVMLLSGCLTAPPKEAAALLNKSDFG